MNVSFYSKKVTRWNGAGGKLHLSILITNSAGVTSKKTRTASQPTEPAGLYEGSSIGLQPTFELRDAASH